MQPQNTDFNPVGPMSDLNLQNCKISGAWPFKFVVICYNGGEKGGKVGNKNIYERSNSEKILGFVHALGMWK